MPGRSGVTIESSQHAGIILQGYNKLRKSNYLLCDCTLLLNNSKYHVHKSLLAASSAFFKTLFSSEGSWKESGKSEIRLSQINEPAFEVLLEYVYTGVICLNNQNIAEIYAITDMLQFQHLKDICHDYLVSQICPSNSIGIWKHAVQFNDYELKRFAWEYILTNLSEVIYQSEFLEVDLDTLVFMLTFNSACEQELVYAAASQWLNNGNSQGIVKKMCLTVDEIMESVLHSASGIDLPCKNYSYCENESSPENCSFVPPEASLVVVGGYNQGLVMNCERLSPESRTWEKVISWGLSGANHYQWIGVLGVRIYALRGDTPILINTMVSMLTPQAAKQLQTAVLDTGWEHEATLPHDCSNFKFCVMNDYIFGCGITLEGTTSTEELCPPMKVCQYTPGSSSWNILMELESDARVFFQLESYRGQLLILGGMSITTQKAVPVFQAYNPATGGYEHLANMICPRCNFGTAVLDNHLFAVGGYGLDGALMHSVERYNFETNTWSHWIYLPSPRACMTCYALQGVIYCIGGEEYSNGTVSLQKVDTLMVILQEKKWMPASSLGQQRYYPSIITL